MAEQNCPPKQTLLDFAAGRGDAAQRSAIQAHLELCAPCRQSVASAANATPDSQRTSATHTSDPLVGSGFYLGCENIDVDSSDPVTRYLDSADEEIQSRFDFRLLGPPREPGALGQLGKYVVLETLGFGGMGVVFRAKDEQLLRTVAIKVMSRDLASSPTARRRFIREARAAAAINHPNVVTIHAVEEHEGTPFLVMEFIRGESLRDRLRHRPKLEIGDVVSIAFQIAAGLAAAHAHGVIHRDIKPGNVMLEDELQRVKITDFGLARVAVDNVDLTSNHIGIGTPAYMSPEQVKGEEIDSRADLFALGCVIYAMLRGHSPFHGRNVLEIARNVAEREPTPPVAATAIPPFLSEVVDRLLQKLPDKRYQSAAEVAELLRRDLEEINRTPTDRLGEILHRPASAHWFRKRPILAIAVTTLFVLGAITFGAGWHFGFFVPRASVRWSTQLGDRESSGAKLDSATGPQSASTLATRPLVTVAKSGDADCATIKEALQQVASGGQVTILDAAEYVENIRLTDSQRNAGVRIVAPERATLRSNDPGAIILVRGIPQLSLEGLKLIATQSQVGIEINGACPGLRVDDIQIERVTNADGSSTSNAALALRNGAAGSEDEPILVRRLKIHSTNVGVVIATLDASSEAPRHIILEESFIQGLSRETSTLLALLRRSENVVIRRNIFARGMLGLSILANDEAVPTQCVIEHNTWHDIRTWLVWSGPLAERLSLQLHHNLIIDAHGISPAARGLTSSDGEEPHFVGNLLVNVGEKDAESFSPLATEMPSFPILSLDPDNPDYLRPDFDQLNAASSVPRPIPGRYSEAK